MPDSKKRSQLSSRFSFQGAPLGARPAPAALVSGLLLVGCAERYEIGALGSTLPAPQEQPSASAAPGFADIPLASDGGDGDVIVDQELQFGAAVGDVDGDGHDDWVTELGNLIYGGPRPADAYYRVPADAPRFALPGDPWYDFAAPRVVPAGDVNGDGFADLLIGSGIHWYGDGAADPDQVRATCSAQHAYLWYGRPERPSGEQDLAVTALPLGDPDDLAAQLYSALLGAMATSRDNSGSCELELSAAGDLDADGYSDFSLTTRFEYQIHKGELPDSTFAFGAGGVTHIFYGHAAGALSQPEELRSAAKFAGIGSVTPLGDVDGDGYADLLVASVKPKFESSPTVRLVSGSAERLQGEVALEQSGVPLEGFAASLVWGSAAPVYQLASSVGDLDGDGLQDFMIEALDGESQFQIGDELYYLFYGGSIRNSIQAEHADAIIRIPGGLGYACAAGDWQGDGFDDLSLVVSIHPGTEELFRNRGDLSPREQELKRRSFDWESVELHVLSGGAARMSGTYSPALFRPDLTPPLTPIRTVPVRHLDPGGPIGDFDGDGRADLTFSISTIGNRPPATFIKYGAPLPNTAPRLH